MSNDYDTIALPDLEGIKVFILPGAFLTNTVHMFAQCNARRANTLEEADLCVFLGGEDVNPSLYQQNPVREVVYYNDDRDRKEAALYIECIKKDIPMFGICRGMQFLHVMNNGVLWQHVTRHQVAHNIVDIETNVRVSATSVHHQMCKSNSFMEVVAVTEDRTTERFKDAYQDLPNNDTCEELEVESCIYHETKCFLVQGHPEIDQVGFYKSWAMNKLCNFLQEIKAKEFFKTCAA